MDHVKLNNIIGQATALPGIITSQTPQAPTASADYVLYYHASDTSLKKCKIDQLPTGVTSVGLTASPGSIFSVSGSPVTGAGTLGLSLDNQTPATFLVGPRLGTGSGAPTFRAIAVDDIDSEITIAALAINWDLGHYFSKTLSANSAFTFSNPNPGQTIRVSLTQDASHTVSWPAGVRWPGGTHPVMTVGAGRHDLYTFTYIGGTNYLGTFDQDFMP